METIETNTILILRERDGDRYYVVDNEKQLRVAYLNVLRQRAEAGFYPSIDTCQRRLADVDRNESDVAKLTDEQIEALPEDTRDAVRVARDAARGRSNYERREIERDLRFAKRLQTVLDAQPDVAPTLKDDQNGRFLVEILMEERSDGVDEHYYLARPEPLV